MMTGAAIDTEVPTATNRTALDAAPIAIWEEDFSDIARFCAEQRAAGTTDIRTFLERHPFILADLVATIRVVNVNETAVQHTGAPTKDALLGPIPPELFSDESWGTFIDQVATIFEGSDRLTSETQGLDMNGNATWQTVHWAAPTIDGVVDYSRVLLMIEDTTSQHLAARQREAHERELRALIEIGARLSSTLEEETVFQQIVDTIPEVTGADHGTILLFDAEHATWTTAYDRCYAYPPLPNHDHTDAIREISTHVYRDAAPTSSNDISIDPRIRGDAGRRAALFPGTSAAVAPILRNGKVLGTLAALNGPTSPAFSARQMSLIETLASQAAVAINNARLYEKIARSHADLQAAHRELQDTQTQLLSAQKLEAIGSLAAGIAHEINTPIQYVGDNIRFLEESAISVFGMIDTLGTIVDTLEANGECTLLVEQYREAEAAADIEFIRAEAPMAITQSLEGIERVAEIVRAMKEFAHPGSDEKAPTDLNRSVETTVAVAKNEWKYVADVVLELDPSLPRVPALAGPLNQSLLIMIVNAAQALSDTIDSASGEKGTITLSTAIEGDDAVIHVADNGPGIPPAIVDRVFDPFFTTKDVGKGSGQGLSIARSVIVDKHAGRLDVETREGVGTTFTIRIPLDPERAA